jgi:hypothetical protein
MTVLFAQYSAWLTLFFYTGNDGTTANSKGFKPSESVLRTELINSRKMATIV